jgi:hypothetical protein
MWLGIDTEPKSIVTNALTTQNESLTRKQMGHSSSSALTSSAPGKQGAN